MNELAINGGNTSATDIVGNTPLHSAAVGGKTKAMQYLVEELDSPMDMVNNAWESAFIVTTSLGLGDFVDFLKGRVPDESIRNKKAEPRRRISRSRKKANADEERKAKKALKYKPMKAEEVVLQQFAAAQM